MRGRTVLSLLNLAAMTATFIVWLAFPRYAEYALYLAVAWIVVAFTLLYSSWASRPISAPSGAAGAAPRATSGTSAGSGGALPSDTAASIGFCIYCANDLPVGAAQCPACGHVVHIR